MGGLGHLASAIAFFASIGLVRACISAHHFVPWSRS